MTLCDTKKFTIVLSFLFLTSCSNIKVVEIDQDLLRVDKFDNKNQLVKSYYKKFDQETGQWLPANCIYDSINIIKLKSNECEFTEMSLHMIRITKESDNIVESSISKDNEIYPGQEEGDQEQQDNNNQEEEGFFMWCEAENCDE